jgi:small subunit ribosomal protein S19
MSMLKKPQYRGMEDTQLKDMPLEEFAKIAKSRGRRAILRALKGMNIEYMQLIDKTRAMKKKKVSKPVRTHCREAVIVPEWLGMAFKVYNGREWKDVEITVEKLGHRLGEYSYTTIFGKHSGPGIGATRGSKFISVK